MTAPEGEGGGWAPSACHNAPGASVCGLCKPFKREEQVPRRTAQYLCRDGYSQRFHPDSIIHENGKIESNSKISGTFRDIDNLFSEIPYNADIMM